MSELNYEELGFKCGLEIHQRLATKAKLFCSCDAQIAEDVPVAEIDRRQRAVAGELGRIDPSATFEATRNRRFVYNAFKASSCLVETDEEPPHELNREALDIALHVAASFNADVPSEFEPMRKEVVDGSDPSAFQRTMIVGQDGYLEFKKRRIGIGGIFLEEESSGIEYGDSSMVVYNLDRFGIPLVEIDTDPDIRTPEEAREVARRIGLILRLTGKVQRGIGSIRQDVNVSIAGGARVEIKGFQELETMDKIIESEVRRQLALLEIGRTLRERNAKVHAPVNVTEIFANTKTKLVRKSVDAGGIVLAARLQGFEGMLGTEISPNRRLGSEISDYAKLAGVGGIIHSDESWSQYGFADDEIGALHQVLDMHKGDGLMLITGPESVCKEAIAFASGRAQQAVHEVPNETRGVDSKALATTFLRPLPGGARMYPETDVRPLDLDAAKYEKLKGEKIDSEAIFAELEKKIKNRQLAEQMLWSPYLSLFTEIVKKTGVDGSVVAPILLEKTKQVRRMGIDVDSISDEAMVHIFERYKKKEITKAAIEEILKQAPKSGAEVLKAIKEKKLERISGSELKKIVEGLGKGRKREEVVREVMRDYRINVDGEELNTLIK
jgi:glutamyl-tRNA(Gln) amidotransferase subunit E